MKRICITYHMSIDRSKPSDDYPHNIETAESCITIPMIEEIADDILEKQSESPYVGKNFSGTAITDILGRLAVLAGYSESTFVMAEEVLPFEV